MLKSVLGLFGILGVFITSSICESQTFTLTDTNTSVHVVGDNPIGIDQWNIHGTNQLFTNTYLWRVGDSGTADFVQNLALTSSTQFGNQFLNLTYTNAAVGFAVDVTYALSGGASFFDLAEIVRVRNIGNAPLDFRLFQYNDFNLRTTPDNDLVTRINSSTMDQGDGNLVVHYVVAGAVPVPAFSQLGSPLLTDLTSTPGMNLDTAAGGGIGQTAAGDVAYAFQWNRTLGVGDNLSISTNKVASAPEPGTIAGLMVGSLYFLRRRKR